MKKNIVKAMLKVMATTAMAAAMFIGGGKMEAKAYNINSDVANMTMVEYVNLYTTGQLPKATKYLCSMTTPEDTNAFAMAMELRIVNSNMDIISADSNFTANDLTAEEETMVNAELMAGVPATAGVAVSHPEMLALVNADRTANGVGQLVWNADLETYALKRAIEVSANYSSPEYWNAYNNGLPTSELAHRGCRAQTGENALLEYEASNATNSNIRWIVSTGHHQNRLLSGVTKYAAASYIDPVTGYETWVELIEY